MNKILSLPILLLIFSYPVSAQFYYKDILSNRELIKEMAKLRENKVRSVEVNSFESDGSESEGFFCERKISRDYRNTELFTRSNISGASLFTNHFDADGKLLSTRDSSAISLTVNNYAYDDKQRIHSIVSSIKSSDDDFNTEISEEHIYRYNESGIPESMLRIKNKYDTTVILFSTDESNNVAIEKDSKNGRKYYYYYDHQNMITDIVHSSEYTTKLLPDYLFEYDNAGKMAQMTTTEEGGSYYYIWRYSYDNGLRSKERCFTKEKKLLGTIEYVYK